MSPRRCGFESRSPSQRLPRYAGVGETTRRLLRQEYAQPPVLAPGVAPCLGRTVTRVTGKHPTAEQRDERVVLPLDPETALRALLRVDPDAPTVELDDDQHDDDDGDLERG